MKHTITCSASERVMSGSFLQPIVIAKNSVGKIEVYYQGEEDLLFNLWPDEAERFALALLKCAYEGS